MSKYCVKCGAKLEDNFQFCNICGEKCYSPYEQNKPYAQNQQNPYYGYQNYNNFGGYQPNAFMPNYNMFNDLPQPVKTITPGKPISKGAFKTLTTLFYITIVSAFILALCYTYKPYEKPIDNLMKLANQNDRDIVNEFYFNDGNSADKEMKETINNNILKSFSADFGNEVVNYDVKEAEQLPESRLSPNDWNLSNDFKITKGYKLNVKFHNNPKDEDDKKISKDATIYVGKINNKWYILNLYDFIN